MLEIGTMEAKLGVVVLSCDGAEVGTFVTGLGLESGFGLGLGLGLGVSFGFGVSCPSGKSIGKNPPTGRSVIGDVSFGFCAM
jgi:hypothetical protein